MLHLAPGLDLPDDFATQGTAIIGVRGSGKSNTEVRFAELLHGASIPFVAVDPKGDWHGIRMEGTGPGLPIPVFGGLYGDFPLTDDLGARIADLLVNENLSAVLDVSRLSKTVGLPRFLTAFCNQLMDRHQQEPHVRCVILEEAHRYIPQTVPAALSRLKEAASSLLLEGRAFGLGCWACTQRPARLHNDVLEEVDTAIIHRIGVTATADLARVRKWVEHEDLGDEIGASLTKLKTGEAWVLSPVALEVVQRVQIDRRTTFDSGATPTVGAKRRTVATMADIDAPAIKEALADAIEKAQETDPKALQAKVAKLQRDLVSAQTATAAPAVEVQVEVLVPTFPGAGLSDAARTAATDALRLYDEGLDSLRGLREALAFALTQLEQEAALRAGDAAAANASRGVRSEPRRPPTTAMPRPLSTPRMADPVSTNGYRAGARRLLEAVASWPEGCTKAQAAVIAGLKKTSGTFGTYLGELRRDGMVVVDGPLLRITPEGLAAAGVEPVPRDPRVVLDYWRGRFRSGARRMLEAVEANPGGISRSDLGGAAGLDPGSGTFGTYLGELRRADLVVVDAGVVRLADWLIV